MNIELVRDNQPDLVPIFRNHDVRHNRLPAEEVIALSQGLRIAACDGDMTGMDSSAVIDAVGAYGIFIAEKEQNQWQNDTYRDVLYGDFYGGGTKIRARVEFAYPDPRTRAYKIGRLLGRKPRGRVSLYRDYIYYQSD